MPYNEFSACVLWGLNFDKASVWGEKCVCWEKDAGF